MGRLGYTGYSINLMPVGAGCDVLIWAAGGVTLLEVEAFSSHLDLIIQDMVDDNRFKHWSEAWIDEGGREV